MALTLSRAGLVVVSLLWSGAALHGQTPQDQDADRRSGPPAGAAVTSVKLYAVVGWEAGREFDASERMSEGPGALLFIHELTRNTAPIIRALDQLRSEYGLLGLQTETVFLSDDRTAAETRLKAVNGSLKLGRPITLSLDGAEGPGDLALNRSCTLTFVSTLDGKVKRSVGLTDTGPNDAPRLRQWVEEVTGPMPEDPRELARLIEARLPQDPAELRKLAVQQALELRRLRQRLQDQSGRAQMQNRRGMRDANPSGERAGQRPAGRTGERPAGRTGEPPQVQVGPSGSLPSVPHPVRKGSAPSDADLQRLLRRLVKKTNTDQEVDTILTEIDRHAGEDEKLQGQVIEMFKLVRSLKERYATEYAQSKIAVALGDETP